MASFHDLQFNDSSGKPVEMKQFRGTVVLIVNTATKCGLTPQFAALEALYQKYRNRNFTVIGFPCNQFAGQEPEPDATMAQTCSINYGVTFMLSEKIHVNGGNTHPVFSFLKSNTKSGLFGKRIKWNFTKFLVGADGIPVKRYSPVTDPADIEKDIVTLLAPLP
jgi:glutathione peroxidase